MSQLIPARIPQEIEDIGYRLIGCAITVHRILGPGFKEPIHEQAFCLELDEAGLKYECQKSILVRYKRWDLPGHKLDLIVGGCVVVELKAIRRLANVHRRQVVSYLKATNLRLGYGDRFQRRRSERGDQKSSSVTFVP